LLETSGVKAVTPQMIKISTDNPAALKLSRSASRDKTTDFSKLDT